MLSVHLDRGEGAGTFSSTWTSFFLAFSFGRLNKLALMSPSGDSLSSVDSFLVSLLWRDLLSSAFAVFFCVSFGFFVVVPISRNAAQPKKQKGTDEFNKGYALLIYANLTYLAWADSPNDSFSREAQSSAAIMLGQNVQDDQSLTMMPSSCQHNLHEIQKAIAAIMTMPSRKDKVHAINKAIAAISSELVDLWKEIGVPRISSDSRRRRPIGGDTVCEIKKAVSEIAEETFQLREVVLQKPRLPRAPSPEDIAESSSNSDNVLTNSPYPSLPMEGEAETRSVFLVMSSLTDPKSAALYEVKCKLGGEDMVEREVTGVTHEPPLLEPIFQFFDDSNVQKLPVFAFIQNAVVSSKLYLLLEEGLTLTHERCGPESLQGYAFDLKTRSLCAFSPPLASMLDGTVVSASGKLYYLASPHCFPTIPATSFQRYDPDADRWEKMPSFPFYSCDWAEMKTVGYAVCDDVILFSLVDFKRRKFKVIAFHISANKWHLVKVDTSGNVPFMGRAVVLGKIIYALLEPEGIIVLSSFRMEDGDDGGVTFSLFRIDELSGLTIASLPYEFDAYITQNLVHLGNQIFCYFKTGTGNSGLGFDYQDICVTTFRIVVEGRSYVIKTLDSTVYAADTTKSVYLTIDFSFSSVDFEPKEVKPSRSEQYLERRRARRGGL